MSAPGIATYDTDDSAIFRHLVCLYTLDECRREEGAEESEQTKA